MANKAQIDAGFPLTDPQWNFNSPEGREYLKVYCQILMRGLQAAAKYATNLAKLYSVKQEVNKSPSAYLEINGGF